MVVYYSSNSTIILEFILCYQKIIQREKWCDEFDAHRIIAEAMNLLSNMGEFEDEFMDC